MGRLMTNGAQAMLNPANVILADIQGYLRQFDALLYTFIRDMVEPEFNQAVEVADVQFNVEQDKFRCIAFRFNPRVWDNLNYNERCFLFTHEVLHVLLRHFSRGAAFFQTLDDASRSDRLLNVAMDIAINELALKQYFAGMPRSAMPLLLEGCFIDTVFKPEDVPFIEQGRDFEYYYRRYLELYGLSDDELRALPGSLDDHSAMLESPVQETVPDSMSGTLPASEPSPWLAALDSLLEQAQLYGLTAESVTADAESPRHTCQGWSEALSDLNALSDKVKERAVKKGKSLDELFKIVIKNAFLKKDVSHPRYNWYGFDRRTSGALSRISPNLILPVRQPRKTPAPEKHKIIVYLDMSGSCSAYSNRFMTLAADLPEDRYEVTLCVFADSVSEVTFNPNTRKASYGRVGWGTSITRVLNDYANREQASEHYDAVFVLTDGFYSNIQQNTRFDFKKWHFFLTPSHDKNIPTASSHYVISRL